MAAQVRTYDKWRQGSSGTMDPAVAEYNSVNAQVYENGTLGPRPGWVQLADTDFSQVWAGTDQLRNLGWFRQTDDDELLVVLFYDGADHRYDTMRLDTLQWKSGGLMDDVGGSAINLHPPQYDDKPRNAYWNDGFNLSALAGQLAYATATGIGTPTAPRVADDFVADVTSTTVFTVGDAAAAGLAVGDVIDIYQADGTSRATNKTISALVGNLVTISVAASGLAAGDLIMHDGSTINAQGFPRCVTLYRERAYYWGFAGYPGRVYYSEPADYVHVQTLNFFDVNTQVDEAAGSVTGMWSVKNALVIARKDNVWLVLTGTSPENGTLRELGKDIVPYHQASAVADNQIYFLHPVGRGVVIATPSAVEAEQLEFLSPLAYPGSTEVRPENDFIPQTAVGDDVTRDLFLPGRKVSDDANLVAVERVNGVFNLSKWSRSGTTDDIVFTGGRPGTLYCAADAGADFEFYSRPFTLNRPARSTGETLGTSLASEDATASGTDVIVDLGEVAAGKGKVVRPIKVVLDFDYWKGGDFSAPELAIDATVLGTESTTPEDTLAQQVVPTSGWADTSGTTPYNRRVPVTLPNSQFGTRFRIRLTYDGIALNSVQVYYDEQEDPR